MLKAKHIFLFVLLSFLVIQVPFLHADPHINISPDSRDAFTDEGLNTSQVINKVNHGYFGLNECDNLIKTPLFSVWLFPVFTVFDTGMTTGRLWLLLGCLFMLLLASRSHEIMPYVLGLFIPIGLLQYHLFQYIHFTMAEMSACCLIILAISRMLMFTQNQKNIQLLQTALLLWIAVGFKNQFAYVLLLLPAWVIIVQLINGNLISRNTLKQLTITFFLLLLGALLYYLLWYLPVKETYDYVMADQAGNRFMPRNKWNPILFEQAQKLLWSSYTKYLSLAFFTGLLLLIPNFIGSKNKIFKVLSLISLSWALLEIHKLGMWFLPSRYMSSLLFSWAFFAAVQFAWAIRNALDFGWKSKIAALVTLSVLILVSGMHVNGVRNLFKERSFVIYGINRKLARIDFGKRPVAGPWAPSLAKGSGAKIIPVWHGYFNDVKLFETHHPKIIISEPDEADSGGAYRERGINLMEMADSAENVKIGKYTLIIYYLP